MLKKLLVLTLPVLAVALYAQCQTNNAKQAHRSQQPSQRITNTPIQNPDGAAFKRENQQHVNADVKVIALPPKDWQDKAAFWITLVLAVVGIAGVGVGIFTLVFLRNQTAQIRRQADQMEAQLSEMRAGTEIAKESAQAARINAKASSIAAIAAEKSADAALIQVKAMKDRERPILVINPVPITEIEIDTPWQNVFMQFENIGGSHAFNVRSESRCELLESGNEPETPDFSTWSMGIIRAGQDKISAPIGTLMYTDEIAKKIVPGNKSLVLHFWGTVHYEDVFRDHRSITFRFIHKIWNVKAQVERDGWVYAPLSTLGGWQQCPHPEHNRES